jgi:glycosyltransferase involved in cell wall biosynthesis
MGRGAPTIPRRTGGMGVSTGVHQVVAGAAPRDAITNHVIVARDVIRGMGLRSEIFCDPRHVAGELTGIVHPSDAWERLARPDDAAILHYSIDSPAFTHVAERASRSAMHYHNVTPPELLWRDAPALALQCSRGREHLGDLADRVSHAAADSHFNAAELEPLGYPPAVVIGVFRQALPPAPAAGGHGGAMRLLFVGRGAPNKCQHDAILAVGALAQAGVDAELRLVGNWGGNHAYLDRCMRLARRTGVEDRVVLLGSVDDAGLAAEYANADVFLCLSEHEGYCVPLLEAMAADLPIVGFAAGAVPETMGDAGLLLHDKTPSVVAEAVVAVSAGALDERIRNGRRTQQQQHSGEAIGERLRRFVAEVAGYC